MRQQIIDIYTFDELTDEAKEKARAWFRGVSYAWCDESADSIKHFCDCFHIKLKDYEIDSTRFDFVADVTNDAFRGLTYRQAEKMQL